MRSVRYALLALALVSGCRSTTIDDTTPCHDGGCDIAQDALVTSTTIAARVDTWLKQTTADSTTLAPEQRCRVPRDGVLRLARAPEPVAGTAHLRVRLADSSLATCALREGYVYEPAFRAIPVVTARRDTWLKSSPANSRDLPAAQRCAVPSGTRLELGAEPTIAPDRVHRGVALLASLPGCSLRNGFLFSEHFDGWPSAETGTLPYAGITLAGLEIPRRGLANPTLRSTLGIDVEPIGTVTTWGGRSWVSGTVSWFGGPDDDGVTATETGAISGEILRQLNNPLAPSAATLRARAAAYYYVALRMDYSRGGRSAWATRRILVANARSGRVAVARVVDWGPNTSTGRLVDVSPQMMSDLGIRTDDTVLVAFANDGASLGLLP